MLYECVVGLDWYGSERKEKKETHSKKPIFQTSIYIYLGIQYEDDNGDAQNINPPTHLYKKEA